MEYASVNNPVICAFFIYMGGPIENLFPTCFSVSQRGFSCPSSAVLLYNYCERAKVQCRTILCMDCIPLADGWPKYDGGIGRDGWEKRQGQISDGQFWKKEGVTECHCFSFCHTLGCVCLGKLNGYFGWGGIRVSWFDVATYCLNFSFNFFSLSSKCSLPET